MIDWASIKSRKMADASVGGGDLVRILLLPAELGGSDVPENVVYVPKHVSVIKGRSTKALLDLFHSDAINRVSVVPEYRGDSFVPSKLLLSAWRDEEPVVHKEEITVW